MSQLIFLFYGTVDVGFVGHVVSQCSEAERPWVSGRYLFVFVKAYGMMDVLSGSVLA